MKKQKEQRIISYIDCFETEAPIYKVLFQDRATSILKYVIDKVANDRYGNENYRLPSILVTGKEGKQLISRSLSTSLCADFEYIQGQHLGQGGGCGSLYRTSDSETVYYISSADELSPYSASLFHKYISHGYLRFHDHIKDEDVRISADNKLFIFSVNDPKKLCPDLYKSIDYHCYLRDYSTMEMELIIELRLKWCHLSFTKEVPAIIVRNGEGSIANCIRLLSMCYLVMRGNGRTRMLIKDVETGIALNKHE